MACVLRNVLSPYSKRPSRLFTSRDATYTRRSKDPVRAKSETSTTSGVGNSNSSEFEEVNGLLVDILGVAMETGPSGVARSLSAAQACASLAATLIVSSQNPQPKPEELLRRVFEALGSTYIKLGQFIASSPTLFPEEYVQEFQNCFDRTPTVPFAKIRHIISTDLGKPVESVFESIDPVPLASASVAQVHAAVLRGSRKEVVVKVLKPEVMDTLNADLAFIYVATRVLTFLNPELKRLSLVDIVADIRASIMEEVDFRKEAKNILAFQNYLRVSGITGALAPDVYSAASSEKVLTLERIYGSPLTDLDAIRSAIDTNTAGSINQNENPAEQILITTLNTWFGSVLACETFHADVHAGNLLVTKEGRVAFIDFGIVGRISPESWGAIQFFFQATASRDFELMAKSLVQLGVTGDDVDTDKFADDLRIIYASIPEEPEVILTQEDGIDGVSATISFDQQEVSALVVKIVQVGDKYGVKLPREFGLLLKQVLYFDRYIRLLAPEMEVVNSERVRFMRSAVDSSSYTIER